MEKRQSPPPELIEKARRLFQQKMEADRRWVERYGQVPQPITTENFGKRLIAVRNTIYAQAPRNYFGDFLRDYALIVFGEEWWKVEMARAESRTPPGRAVVGRKHTIHEHAVFATGWFAQRCAERDCGGVHGFRI